MNKQTYQEQEADNFEGCSNCGSVDAIDGIHRCPDCEQEMSKKECDYGLCNECIWLLDK